MSAFDSVKDLAAKAQTLVNENAAKAQTLVNENASKAKSLIVSKKGDIDSAVDKAASFVDTQTKGKFTAQVSKVQENAKKIVPAE
ncbi:MULTISPECIES: antitoxin [Hoyosella]|uniref:Antitoxin n=2 Tax=Hoyosella TaxID=697025 RepID=F6EMB3_HOYSD|nr:MULTISPECIES: antitoxin [Hoyosella]AEF39319.1 hypothetical protein AS9A_0867 [Hoyosella subflava DQS3-9A1]MBB3039340.1 hypothetical protein [Hoyosella altamirensis]